MNKVSPTSVRIPPDLKKQLEEIAASEHWTFNQSVVEAIKLLVKEKVN